MAQQIFLRSKSSCVAVTQPAGCGGEGYKMNGEWSIVNSALVKARTAFLLNKKNALEKFVIILNYPLPIAH